MVKNMNSLSSNKKILISVGVFAVIMVVLVAMLMILGGNSDNQNENFNEEPVYNGSADYNGNYESLTQESLSSYPVTTSPAMNTQDIRFSEKQAAIMTAYTSGQYYMRGTIVADGVSTPIDLAMSGKNFYTTTEFEGMNLGVMYLNGRVYFINKKEKKYIDLQTITALMGTDIGFDLSELDVISESMDMTQYNFQELEKIPVMIGDTEGECYKFYNSDMALWLYFANDELRQIDLGSPDGTVSTTTVVDEFSTEIPSGVLTLRGLTMSTIFDFFGEEFMQQLQQAQ